MTASGAKRWLRRVLPRDLDPLSGLTRLTAGVGGADEAARARRGMWLHATVQRPPVLQTPHTVVHRQNKLEVRYYAPRTQSEAGEPVVAGCPVVVVPSMINRAWICDLEPDRSLVQGLADRGHPTYLLDWGVPGREDAHQTLADTVLGLMHRAVDRSCRHAGADRAVLLGYCQGGILSSMYAALRPERVAGLVALTTPVKFKEGGRFAAFCRPEVCDAKALVGPDGLVEAEVMAPAFKLLDPMGNWQKFLALERASRDPSQLTRALARERWLEENVPLPGPLAVEFIEKGYQQDRLLAGTWSLAGERIDLGRITCPVWVTPASRDFIAPPPACLPLAKAVGSSDVQVAMQQAGHIGVVVGSWGPRHYYPALDQWLRRVQGLPALPEAA